MGGWAWWAADRGIEFEEFRAKVHDIDRSESRTGSYHLTDDGAPQAPLATTFPPDGRLVLTLVPLPAAQVG